MVDPKLTMDAEVEAIVHTVRPKIKALLRTRSYYSTADMMQQYKTHIWGLVEYHNAAVLHATSTITGRIDRLQTSFLEELQVTQEDAFLEFNFGPTSFRRDIGVLGFLHKRVIEKCHPAIIKMLPFSDQPASSWWHSKQLYAYLEECIAKRSLYERSLFAHVHVYNRLPQHLVDIESVSAFQKALVQIARNRCEAGDGGWPMSFHNVAELGRALRYQ
jgi:hypothetical protein